MRFASDVVRFDFCDIPIIGNLVTGFLVGLTPEGAALCDDLEQGTIAEQEALARDETLMKCLLSHGFFCDKDQDERKTTDHSPLKLAYLHVTQRCNLNCVGCYSLDATRNKIADASTEQMLHAISELGDIGCETLIVSGGEPFLRQDLPELTKHAKDKGIRTITVITNGTCVTSVILSQLVPFVDTIAVSIDGYSPEAPAHIRGSQRFNVITSAIKLIQAAGIHAHLTPTLHRKNYEDMAHYISLAEELGVTMNYSLFSCDYEDPTVCELLPRDTELETIATTLLSMGCSISASNTATGVNLTVKQNCGAGVKEVSIAADGAVYPCHMLHRPDWKMGNIFQESLARILGSKHAKRIAMVNVNNIEECSNCLHKYFCGGGCRARALFRFGDITNKDAYCTLMKTFYEQIGKQLQAQLRAQ